MRRLAFLLLLVLAGCRGCGEDERSGGPTMPPGLLVPAADAAAFETARGDLAVHRERIAGVELHGARANDVERNDVEAGAEDAVYLSLEAMAVFHDAFARAYQASADGGTFDLFVPRIVEGRALAAELARFLERLPAAEPGASGSARRDVLTQTGAALIQLAEARGRLWVLTVGAVSDR